MQEQFHYRERIVKKVQSNTEFAGSRDILFEDAIKVGSMSVSYAEMEGIDDTNEFVTTQNSDSGNKYLLTEKHYLNGLSDTHGGLEFSYNLNAFQVILLF